MQSLLAKLQADVAHRKRGRSAVWPTVRKFVALGAVAGIAFALGRVSGAPEEEPIPLPGLDAELVRAGAGDHELQRAYLEKLQRIYTHSARYKIPADLAAAIEDIALAENVDLRVAFELVRVESQFNPRARSPVGAVGYTQLMPATARMLQPGIRDHEMYDRDTNLRLGFRFLRYLIDRYDGDVRLALLAYNRGPAIVDTHVARGTNPHNGYVQRVLGR